MIVVDASAAVVGLLAAGATRQVLADESIAVPHLVDAEVASALRAQAGRGAIPSDGAGLALERWSRLGVERHPMRGLLPRVWALRESLSAYDAVYVALAEHLACPLLTADRRLGRTPGPTCPITMVPG